MLNAQLVARQEMDSLLARIQRLLEIQETRPDMITDNQKVFVRMTREAFIYCLDNELHITGDERAQWEQHIQLCTELLREKD